MKSAFPDKLKELYLAREPRSRGQTIAESVAKMLVVLAVTVLTTELMFGLDLGTQNMIMLYLLAVLVISFITPGYVYGILAALLSTFAFDFMLNEPRYGFSFTTGLPITLFIMLLVTIVTSTLTIRVKERARHAVEQRQQTLIINEINQQLLAARDLGAIVKTTNEYLTEHLGRPALLYTLDPFPLESSCPEPAEPARGPAAAFYTPEQCKRVHRIFRIGKSETERPVDDTVCDVYNIPVVSRGKVLGVIGVDCLENPITPLCVTFVEMVAVQVARALELQYLSDERQSAAVSAEKEKMRGTLLRSISHDLRTPLTSILGASSTILEQKGLDAETLESLVKDIKLDAQWLIRMVENILIITRFSGDNLKAVKTPEAAEEVVSEAVSIVRKRFPDYIIHVHIPDELLIVPMDATLISQLLINLLENAIKNSPEGSLILVDLKKTDNYAEFDISDNGSGIPAHLLHNLFEVHSPTKEQAVDASRGMGIGLSICKTIVQAHGGQIEGHNRSTQGAKFSFRLPLRETEADIRDA